MTRWSLSIALALLTCFAVGCANSTKIYVKSTERTNDGNTLYMAVRSVDSKPSITGERYQEAASKLFTDPPDPSILNSQPIFPGNTVSVAVDDTDKDIVLYFFYTNPGPNWRVPLHRPLPAEVYIDLGQHQIERVQIRKR
jgi:hypothetical protein